MSDPLNNSKLPRSPQPVDPEKVLTKQTINIFQNVCKWLFIATCLIFSFLFYKLYLFQKHLYGDQKSMDKIYHILTYGMFFGVTYTILDFIFHQFLEKLVIQYFLNSQSFQSKQALQKRAYTIIKWGYSILFYGSCSIMGFYCLKGSSFVPTWMGGQNGYLRSQEYFFKDQQNVFPITIFYMIEFGKHFSRLIVHSLVRQEGKYYEFTLHHMLSVALIVFSYLSNLWLPGIVVLLTHDGSDALFLIARFYKDFKYSISFVVNILGVVGILSWIVFRGILYVKYLVYPVTERFIFHMSVDNIGSEIIFWPGAYISLMLWTLLVMDYVWIFTMTKGLIVMLTTKKTKSQ